MANVPFGQAARATRAVSSGMVPSPLAYIDIDILLTLLLFAAFSLYFTTPVFLSFANKVL